MLISFESLIEKYKISLKGILHVGAHECEEIGYYEKYIDRDKILWVEAMSDKVDICKKKYENINIENAVVSDKEEIVKFNVCNGTQSSSFLEFGLHKKYHPWAKFEKSFNVKTKLLKDILPKYNINYNFINLDIQGSELRALKGMEDYLHTIDYIYTEVNEDYVYIDCNLITDIDLYLKKYGFIRVETCWYGDCKWGDAFYIKENN